LAHIWLFFGPIHSKSGKSGGDGYFGQEKLAEKMLKSQQNKNRDKSA